MISINVLEASKVNNTSSITNVVSKKIDTKVESLFTEEAIQEIKGTETIPVRTDTGDFKTVALEKLSSGAPIGNYIESIPNDYGIPQVAGLLVGDPLSGGEGTLITPAIFMTSGIMASKYNFDIDSGLRFENGKLVLATELTGEGRRANIATERYVDNAIKNINISNPTYDDSELRDAISEKVDADFVNEAIASAITLTINTAV